MGDWNNSYNAKESILELFAACRQYLGFEPFIVAIDIPNRWNTLSPKDWSDVDNFIYIPGNIAQIEQFLTNFKDMDSFDVYTPLQSLWRSNRYELIRVNTL